MGIREKMNNNPGMTTGITAAIIVIALIVIVWQLAGSGAPKLPTKAFFTIDDGATWFADSVKNRAPFQHDGKTAYKVHVFKCAGGQPFVAYMERYTPEALKKMQQADANPDAPPPFLDPMMMASIEVKAPGTGDKGWINMNTAQAMTITRITCKDGDPNSIEPVIP